MRRRAEALKRLPKEGRAYLAWRDGRLVLLTGQQRELRVFARDGAPATAAFAKSLAALRQIHPGGGLSQRHPAFALNEPQQPGDPAALATLDLDELGIAR